MHIPIYAVPFYLFVDIFLSWIYDFKMKNNNNVYFTITNNDKRSHLRSGMFLSAPSIFRCEMFSISSSLYFRRKHILCYTTLCNPFRHSVSFHFRHIKFARSSPNGSFINADQFFMAHWLYSGFISHSLLHIFIEINREDRNKFDGGIE